MRSYYITFGQTHTHSINGFAYDKDVVCEIKSSSHEEARSIAFENFGDKFFTSYNDKPEMKYFPRGIKRFF